jgi:hypothetical protein
MQNFIGIVGDDLQKPLGLIQADGLMIERLL